MEFKLNGRSLLFNNHIVAQVEDGHFHISLYWLRAAGFMGDVVIDEGLFGEKQSNVSIYRIKPQIK